MSIESPSVFCNFSVREKFESINGFEPINENLKIDGRDVSIHIQHPFGVTINPNLGYVVSIRFLLSGDSVETWEIIESRDQMVLRLLRSSGKLVLNNEVECDRLWDGETAVLDFSSNLVTPGGRLLRENDFSGFKSDLFKDSKQVIIPLRQLKESLEYFNQK